MLFVLFRHVSDMAKIKEISGQSGAFRFVFVRHGFLKRYRKRYRKALAESCCRKGIFLNSIRLQEKKALNALTGIGRFCCKRIDDSKDLRILRGILYT